MGNDDDGEIQKKKEDLHGHLYYHTLEGTSGVMTVVLGGHGSSL